jgi:lipid A 3-O-deacylase
MGSRLARWLVVCLVCVPGVALGQSGGTRRADLAVLAGAFNFGHGHPTTLVGVELRGQIGHDWKVGRSELKWRPEIGAFGTTDSAFYGWVGMRLDLETPKRWRFSIAFDPGAYSAGDDKELGNTVEFRSSFEVLHPIGRRQQIGATVFHMSNAKLSDVNPGANSVALVWTLRLDHSGG